VISDAHEGLKALARGITAELRRAGSEREVVICEIGSEVRLPPNSDCSRARQQGLFSIAASVKLRPDDFMLSPFLCSG
jgi:hypothetical protein